MKLSQKAVLLLDTSSESDLLKDGIRAIFLLPNATSLIQSMDQGVKRLYRKSLIWFLIKGLDDRTQVVQHLKLLNMKKFG